MKKDNGQTGRSRRKAGPKTPQVSIRGETYAKLKAYCDEHGLSPGQLIDKLCAGYLNGELLSPPKPRSAKTKAKGERKKANGDSGDQAGAAANHTKIRF